MLHTPTARYIFRFAFFVRRQYNNPKQHRIIPRTFAGTVRCCPDIHRLGMPGFSVLRLNAARRSVMGLFEILLVCIGISFDVLAISVCYGAVLMEIDKLKLLKVIGIFCTTQVAAAAIGNLCVFLPMFRDRAESTGSLYSFCSIVLMLALGFFLLYKSRKNADILERRAELDFRKIALSAVFAAADSLFAGLLFSFMGANILVSVICLFVVTALAVTAGMYTGYRLGYEPKKNAYIIGASVLLVAAVDVFIRILAE